MSDFKKAIGVLSKARQTSMFDKPRREVIGTYGDKPVHFDSHKTEGLTGPDHEHAREVHAAHHWYHRRKRIQEQYHSSLAAHHEVLMTYHSALSAYHSGRGIETATSRYRRGVIDQLGKRPQQAREKTDKVTATQVGVEHPNAFYDGWSVE